MLIVNVDAAYDRHTRLASYAFVIAQFKQGQIIYQEANALSEIKDNHQAEIVALKQALNYLLLHQHVNDFISIQTDSQLLAQSVEKSYAKHYKTEIDEIMTLLSNFTNYYIKLIPDKQNASAHVLATERLFKEKQSRAK